jgi:4-diphosphocytidyl-2-C-methyl-D-erythritol kinase
MITFPHCKINIGLHVLGKRADGYHNIETVFYPVPLEDMLEMIPSKQDGLQLTNEGLKIEGDPASNIITKAYELLLPRISNIVPADLPGRVAGQLSAVHAPVPTRGVSACLYKSIPMGAGLGGGSSDGAFALKLLNDTFNLNLSHEELSGYAQQLGSDCAFFITRTPCYAEGRGEVLQPVKVSLKNYYLVILAPGVHVRTADAYASVVPRGASDAKLRDLIATPVDEWNEVIKNDFEPTVFEKYPAIRDLKNELYKAGAVYASMSGSGSSVYGIFREKMNAYGKWGQLACFERMMVL